VPALAVRQPARVLPPVLPRLRIPRRRAAGWIDAGAHRTALRRSLAGSDSDRRHRAAPGASRSRIRRRAAAVDPGRRRCHREGGDDSRRGEQPRARALPPSRFPARRFERHLLPDALDTQRDRCGVTRPLSRRAPTKTRRHEEFLVLKNFVCFVALWEIAPVSSRTARKSGAAAKAEGTKDSLYKENFVCFVPSWEPAGVPTGRGRDRIRPPTPL